MGGLRLALTLFTVAPLRADRFDRPAARTAMALAPLVGALLGALLGLIGWAVRAAGATPLLAAAIVVALAVLLTRGMHVDGLADTADGLGSYGTAEKALAIMKKSDIGPFGVAAIAVVLLVETAAASSLLSTTATPPAGSAALPATASGLPAGVHGLVALAAAFAAGRLAATVACRRGLPAARPDGLGALVAGTIGRSLLAVAVLATAALAALAHPWRGPLAVAGAVAVSWLLTEHARRRLGGVTGDVMGGAIELSTTTALVVLAMGDLS
ncbi:adenosylcobinamide-GDP ribazoletransferase [Dactylosporangium roseum]|uniref:Adenosylcobinamide-GDP ribazoletransferase n=1 Tax=Dactylosporangium roseum TaxID=47989 RepID=A0ABY5Z161_9ACTN|nr:adenosylcobinamide-GDP ribazoletransferase [Dactylosporangium roseum]UWZ35341.1 adenosylcobinamide-GDP ribazoletransferase [Dactylosporangium roseum]